MDVQANGFAVVDWEGNGHHTEMERVHLAWRDYYDRVGWLRTRTHGRPDDAELAVVEAAGVTAIEARRPPSP